MAVIGRRLVVVAAAAIVAASGSMVGATTVHAAVSAPFAVITSPTDGATVTGIFYATVSAGVAPASGDAVKTVRWYVNGGLRAEHACGPSPDTTVCADALAIDPSTLLAALPSSLTAQLVTANGVTVTSSAVNVVTPLNLMQVSILTPSSGDSVSGAVSVSVHASMGIISSDTTKSLTLLVDDVATGVFVCPGGADPYQCDTSFTWHAETASGAHTLRVRLRSTLGHYATSAPVVVVLPSTVPSVLVSSPAPSGVVTGAVAVGVVAVDPTSGDAPESVAVYADGHLVDAASCTAGSNLSLCAETLAWDARRLVGYHVLKAVLTTRNHVVTTSPEVRVGVLSRTVTTMTRPRPVVSGTTVTLRGKVTRLNDGGPAPGVRVVVARKSAVGRDSSVTTVTSASGTFAVAFRVMTNSSFRATTSATSLLGSSVKALTLPVMAKVTCRPMVARARPHQVVRGYCLMPYMPAHTFAELVWRYRGINNSLATGSTGAGRVYFGVYFARRGTYYVRLRFYGNRVFVPSNGPLMKITVV
jgi:hypothetical protein